MLESRALIGCLRGSRLTCPKRGWLCASVRAWLSAISWWPWDDKDWLKSFSSLAGQWRCKLHCVYFTQNTEQAIVVNFHLNYLNSMKLNFKEFKWKSANMHRTKEEIGIFGFHYSDTFPACLLFFPQWLVLCISCYKSIAISIMLIFIIIYVIIVDVILLMRKVTLYTTLIYIVIHVIRICHLPHIFFNLHMHQNITSCIKLFIHVLVVGWNCIGGLINMFSII